MRAGPWSAVVPAGPGKASAVGGRPRVGVRAGEDPHRFPAVRQETARWERHGGGGVGWGLVREVDVDGPVTG
ncbi:MAG: hypothetical protein MOP51_675 [Citricoccus sp.]|nr:hypothetical protein [Citricoccus sp. WCRC_4]